MWIGYLEVLPGYMTQGQTHEELQENLDFSTNLPPLRRKAARGEAHDYNC
jgi:hypothetical protein